MEPTELTDSNGNVIFRCAGLFLGQDISEVDLRKVRNIPMEYIMRCRLSMLDVLKRVAKKEILSLSKAIIEGRIDGLRYNGKCADFIGTLANARKGKRKPKYDHVIAFCESIEYEMGLHNPVEHWFTQIRLGDKPSTNQFSQKALKWCEQALQHSI